MENQSSSNLSNTSSFQPVTDPTVDIQPAPEITPAQSQPKSQKVRLIIMAMIIVAFGAAVFLAQQKKPTLTTSASPSPESTANSATTVVESEKVVGTLPQTDPTQTFTIPVDIPVNRAVYAINSKKDSKATSVMSVDGVLGKTYDEIKELRISPNGQRVAYVATQGEKYYVVVDGVEGKPYDYIKNIKFSPDSKHLAYAAGMDIFWPDESDAQPQTKSAFIVLDGKEQKHYQGTSVDYSQAEDYDVAFSKDSNHIAYTAVRDLSQNDHLVVKDQTEITANLSQNCAQFVGDTNELAYSAVQKDKTNVIVVGDEVVARETFIPMSPTVDHCFLIGQDKTQLAYSYYDSVKSKNFSKVNGKIIDGTFQAFTYSPSGTHYAYFSGPTIGPYSFVLDGTNIGAVPGHSRQAIFSPDDNLLIYVENMSESEKTYNIHVLSAKTLQEVGVIHVDGFRGEVAPAFSPDGRSISFLGWKDRDIVLKTLSLEQFLK